MLKSILVAVALCGLPLRAQDTPQRPATLESAVARSIEILLDVQEGEAKDQWPYEGVYRYPRREIPIGYRCGGTSIAATALLETPGHDSDPRRLAAVERATRFVLSCLEHPLMSSDFRGTYDVRGWGHAYALTFLLKVRAHGGLQEDLATRIERAVDWLIKTLTKTAIPESGGWNYSRPHRYGDARNGASAFMTGPTLQALFAAKAAGHTIPKKVVKEALDALERGRTKSGGYRYTSPGEANHEADESDLGMMDKKPGSAGRMCVTEATLTLAGRGDPDRLLDAVKTFFEHHDALKVRKAKNNTHIPPYGVAPYYFMYAHYYAAQAIELLPASTERSALRTRMVQLTLAEQNEGGGWNDRVFPRSINFGTAFGMSALLMPGLDTPARWSED